MLVTVCLCVGFPFHMKRVVFVKCFGIASLVLWWDLLVKRHTFRPFLRLSFDGFHSFSLVKGMVSKRNYNICSFFSLVLWKGVIVQFCLMSKSMFSLVVRFLSSSVVRLKVIKLLLCRGFGKALRTLGVFVEVGFILSNDVLLSIFFPIMSKNKRCL